MVVVVCLASRKDKEHVCCYDTGFLRPRMRVKQCGSTACRASKLSPTALGLPGVFTISLSTLTPTSLSQHTAPPASPRAHGWTYVEPRTPASGRDRIAVFTFCEACRNRSEVVQGGMHAPLPSTPACPPSAWPSQSLVLAFESAPELLPA